MPDEPEDRPDDPQDPPPDPAARPDEGPYGEHGWGGRQAAPGGQQRQQHHGQQPQQSTDPSTPGSWPSGGDQGGRAWATSGTGGEDHPRTTIAFVLSLIALVFVVLLFWLIIPPLLAIPMAIVGIVFGGQARKDMRAQPDRYRNQGLATAAVVLGWITLGLIVVGIVLLVLVIAIFSVSFSEFWNDPQFQEEFLDEIQRQSLRLPI